MHHGDPKKTSEDIRPFLPPKLTNICSAAGEQLAGSARASAARGVSSHGPWIHGPHGPHGPMPPMPPLAPMAEHHGWMESQGWAKSETQGRSPRPPELDQVEKTHFRPNLKGPSVLEHMYTGNWLGDLPSYL